MHERILLSELANHVGERVTVMGWLHRLRELSQVAFLIVRDRSGLGQVVITKPGQATKLPAETVLAVTGEVLASDQAPGGAELHEPRIEVLAAPLEPPPLELWRPSLAASLPSQLDLAPLALRHPRRRAAFELAAASLAGFRSAMQGLGFTEVQTPKIVACATESGANVFALDYFGGPAFLAQSPQFYKQMMVGVFERVFETGPVFRAEPHDTARHLSEFVSLDAELGFISDHRDVMGVVREAFAGMVEAMSVRARGALELLALELPEVPSEIPSIHFADAQGLIASDTDESLQHEYDLAPAHERWLGEWARREHGSEFVFVTGYPMRVRPFYTHPDPGRPEFSNGFDLLFRGMELITGGQRLHRHEDYLSALASCGESPDLYQPYLQAFKYGTPPHGGFAIGLERWIARVVG
ncbi:MAG: aspartate--tRNA(Asn) ligase, partial [Actinomycetota bacterium]|nr:aspartate--tRNA(Asn) ligase [Actinomycetota bacterium]